MSAGVKYCKHLRHPNMANIMSFRINKNDDLLSVSVHSSLHLQSNEVLIYFVEAYRKVHNGRISFEYWVTTWYSGGSSIKIKTHSRTVDPCFKKKIWHSHQFYHNGFLVISEAWVTLKYLFSLLLLGHIFLWSIVDSYCDNEIVEGNWEEVSNQNVGVTSLHHDRHTSN